MAQPPGRSQPGGDNRRSVLPAALFPPTLKKIILRANRGRGMTKKRPVVGVIGSAHLVEGKFTAQRVGERPLRAVAETAGALPLIFAGTPKITDIGARLAAAAAILLTGARANVLPSHFGKDEHPAHEPYDQNRDALALKLIG